MCFTNLTEIRLRSPIQSHNGSAPSSLKDKNNYTYDPGELKQLALNINHDERYKVMPFGAVRRIRELGLNKRLNRKKIKARNKWIQSGVNFDNLIAVEVRNTDGRIHETQLTIATLNMRSIKNSSQLVLRELMHLGVNLIIITETWLKDNPDDQNLINRSEFNKSP